MQQPAERETQRLSPGTLILGVFALLFALVGAYGVKKYLQERTPPPATVEKKIEKNLSRACRWP